MDQLNFQCVIQGHYQDLKKKNAPIKIIYVDVILYKFITRGLFGKLILKKINNRILTSN